MKQLKLEIKPIFLQSIMGQFAHPIFKTGDYSPVMKEYVAKKDKEAS